MMLKNIALALIVCVTSGVALADGQKLEAAIGGGAGGALGAVVGSELGDRKGAIIGAAIGAGVGAAIATDGGDKSHAQSGTSVEVKVGTSGSSHSQGHFCPPGQAKKGRC